MHSWTVHLPPGPARAPVLIPEGFSLWACLFGPLWLFAKGAWLAGVVVLAVLVGVEFLPMPWGMAVALAIHLLLGWHGNDLRRWTLARRGWSFAHLVLGADADSALADGGQRLLR